MFCHVLGCFLASCVGGLWKHRKQATKGATEVLATVRLALAALLVTTLMGALLAASFAWPLPFSRLYTNAHGAWGLLGRSEEHTSELQSLLRISYAVFCLKNKKRRRLRTDM